MRDRGAYIACILDNWWWFRNSTDNEFRFPLSKPHFAKVWCSAAVLSSTHLMSDRGSFLRHPELELGRFRHLAGVPGWIPNNDYMGVAHTRSGADLGLDFSGHGLGCRTIG